VAYGARLESVLGLRTQGLAKMTPHEESHASLLALDSWCCCQLDYKSKVSLSPQERDTQIIMVSPAA